MRECIAAQQSRRRLLYFGGPMESEGMTPTQYYVNSWKKEYFLLTPSEFDAVFDGFTFVISNTGVKQDYVSSPAEEIYRRYAALYQLLSSGKRCVWNEDWETLSFWTGVTAHPENICYRKMDKLCIPDFKEPCIEVGAFCVYPFKGSPLSKGWELSQFPQYTCGVEMLFPSKIEMKDGESRTIEELADYAAWGELRGRIKEIAPTLHIDFNGKKYNTHIRVSANARKDFAAFYAVREIGILVPDKN